jgi:hypothetical protein
MKNRRGNKKMRYTIFLFGEAEKGDFCTPLLLKSLPQLAETFGNPPAESEGIRYAVQALLYERELLYYRVKEEGFSIGDYLRGLKMLENKEIYSNVAAICMPGVGDAEIIDATSTICSVRKTFLITTEKDLYDLLTGF